MKLSYQHANPGSGNESFLLRFDEKGRERTPCVLVDSGNGVDIDGLLLSDDYLAAVLLTHAHLDHYRTLGTNLRDGAPVYASTDTASTLETVLSEAKRHRDLGDTEAVLDALDGVDGWRTVVDRVRLHPVPAGHAPGATGFVVEFQDGDPHHVLVTGDFTRRKTAGYPGLDVGATDIEAVFLVGATSENVPETLTDIIGTALERAQEGSTTLVTASGLSGVHIAYLLGYVSNRVGGPSVTVVGQAAKLYEGLDYAAPNVSSVPKFRSPTEVLASGRVTVAGPEVPVDGSAERLFEYISDDPGATLLQVTSGGTDPVDGGECTVYTRTFSNHPTDTAVDTLVDELDPIEVVIVHQSSQKSNRFKDRYEALTWATDDYEEYTLYDDGWQGPPWVHDSTVRAAVSDGLAPRFAVEDLPVPSRTEVDLAAEGLDIGRLESLLASPDPPDGSETRTAPDDTAPAERDALDAIESRLSAIEALVSGHRIRARVVDAGGGVMLLRVLDADCDLDDGEVIEASIRDTSPAGGEMDDA